MREKAKTLISYNIRKFTGLVRILLS